MPGGQGGTDILVVPSGDWKAIAPYHSHMAALRGIENGCTVIRPVTRGTSLATDAYGNRLSETDFFKLESHAMVADVPTRGVNTIYNVIGDILAYACIAFLAFQVIFQLILVVRQSFGPNKLSGQAA